MTDNLKLWKSFFCTHPGGVKPIGGGRLGAAGLSAASPYKSIERVTRQWGPMGSSWGIVPVEIRTGAKWTYAKCVLWYPDADGIMSRSAVMAIIAHALAKGAEAAVPVTRDLKDERAYGVIVQVGGALTSQEGPKSAITNALSKCLSWLGVAGDVHSGLHDDPAYISWAAKNLASNGDRLDAQPLPQTQAQAQSPPPLPPPPPPQPPSHLPPAANAELASREQVGGLITMLRAYEDEYQLTRAQTIALCVSAVERCGHGSRGRVLPADLTVDEYRAIVARIRETVEARRAMHASAPAGTVAAGTSAYPAQVFEPPPAPPAPTEETSQTGPMGVQEGWEDDAPF